MAKSSNQKLKIIYLMNIMLEKTDETHGITMAEIIKALGAYGISAGRKSIYNDMENLRKYGLDIIGVQEKRNYYYYVGKRQFELAELKLLVDSVQSARFITIKKSNELIKKLEAFTSQYEASQLQRQVYVKERVKTMNESIYYNVDRIHTAIGKNSKITFQYFQWNVRKEMILRKEGALYEISPWALVCNNENYYLIAYDSLEKEIRHFRVDKMLHIEITNTKRDGKDAFQKCDIASYEKKMFGMFNGEEEIVKIECVDSLAGVIIDRFGKEVSLIKSDEEHFIVNVKVAVSRQFLAWIIALGEEVRIISPKSVIHKMNEEIERLIRQYRD